MSENDKKKQNILTAPHVPPSTNAPLQFFVLSLGRDDRKHFYEENLKILPELQFFQAVNGYDKTETVQEFKKLNIPFYNIMYPIYGTLANIITKIKAMKYQIEHKIPFICFIEDDIILKPTFKPFIQYAITNYLRNNINILRLGPWGEGYVTSLYSSRRILQYLHKKGIVDNIDNQLKYFCGPEFEITGTPWELHHFDGVRDCLSTPLLDQQFYGSLPPKQNMSSLASRTIYGNAGLAGKGGLSHQSIFASANLRRMQKDTRARRR